jgi:hypothetical protein
MNTLLAVLTGGGITAAATVLAAYLTNSLGTQRDREARAQERLERTYTALGMFLSHYQDWASSVHPFLGPVPAPEPFPAEERWRVETLVTNHGSPEVRRLLDEWNVQRRKIDNADQTIRLAEGSRSEDLDKEALRERHALEGYRAEMRQAAEAIRARTAAELNGQVAVPALPAGRPRPRSLRHRDDGNPAIGS